LGGAEARAIGLVNGVFPDAEALHAGVLEVARQIAAKSPLAVRGTKEMILYARDHSVSDALNYVATWNAGMISEADLREAMAAQQEQRPPRFDD
jgi:enoyl-CoA hydratase